MKEISEIYNKCPAFKALSLKNQKFVLEYIKDFNGKQAAIRAKYAKNSAEVQASRLLSNDKVSAALSEVSAIILQGDIADIQEIGQFLTRSLRGSITDIIGFNSEGLTFCADSEDLDRNTARLLKKVKVTEKTSQKGDWTECKTEVEVHDPLKAAELLGRYHGMFKDDKLSVIINNFRNLNPETLKQFTKDELINLRDGTADETLLARFSALANSSTSRA